MMERVPMTAAGYDKLSKELKQLQMVERPAISAAIEEARGHGDLKENAEYHAAKNQQGLTEARIRYLESTLSRVDVVHPERLSGDKIMMGATVGLVELSAHGDTDQQKTYALVGPDEAAIERGLLSVTSPIGQALLGKRAGDEVVVHAPGGKRTYEVETVEFKVVAV